MRVALVGFRGVGKSTIAKELQKHYGVLAISLDAFIENHEHMTIAEIIEKKGWGYFRQKERESLENLVKMDGDLIVDTGGGIVEDGGGQKALSKIQLLKDNFCCVHITMDEKEILNRLERIGSNSTRVSIHGFSLQSLFRKRQPWFVELADVQIDITGLSISQATKFVIEKIDTECLC